MRHRLRHDGGYEALRKRLPWLAVNLVTAFIAASVVRFFEPTTSGAERWKEQGDSPFDLVLSLSGDDFAVMGMHPVGYYDLSVAGVPVHAAETTFHEWAAPPQTVLGRV